MKTKTPNFVKLLSFLTIFLAAFSCQEDGVAPPKLQPSYSVAPLADGLIKDQILSWVENNKRPSKNGVICNTCPTLPSGYDYQNATEVHISGTNWTHYIAWKTSGNTSTNKEAITLFYDSGGNYKNYLKTKWRKSGSYTHYTYYLPENNFSYFQEWRVWDDNGSVERSSVLSIRPPSACGQIISDCITDFYANKGYGSVALWGLTLFSPEVGLGVIGGCMLGCAVGL